MSSTWNVIKIPFVDEDFVYLHSEFSFCIEVIVKKYFLIHKRDGKIEKY